MTFNSFDSFKSLVQGIDGLVATFNDTIDFEQILNYDITSDNKYLFFENPVYESFLTSIQGYSSLYKYERLKDKDYSHFDKLLNSLIDGTELPKAVDPPKSSSNTVSNEIKKEDVVYDETIQLLFNDKREIIIENDIFKIIDNERLIRVYDKNFKRKEES